MERAGQITFGKEFYDYFDIEGKYYIKHDFSLSDIFSNQQIPFTAFQRYYGEPKDKILEALRLIEVGTERFFKYAEADISPKRAIVDKDGQITQLSYEELLKQLEKEIELRPDNRKTTAIYAGAIIGYISEEAKKLVKAIELTRSSETLKGTEKTLEEAFKAKMSEFNFKVGVILSEGKVKLKNGVIDIDGFLYSFLGETFKPAVQDNKDVHFQDYYKNYSAIKNVLEVYLIMKNQAGNHPAITKAIDEYKDAVLECLKFSNRDDNDLLKGVIKESEASEKLKEGLKKISGTTAFKCITFGQKLMRNINNHSTKPASLFLYERIVLLENLSKEFRLFMRSGNDVFDDMISYQIKQFTQLCKKPLRSAFHTGELMPDEEAIAIKDDILKLLTKKKDEIPKSLPNDRSDELYSQIDLAVQFIEIMEKARKIDLQKLTEKAHADRPMPKDEVQVNKDLSKILAEIKALNTEKLQKSR